MKRVIYLCIILVFFGTEVQARENMSVVEHSISLKPLIINEDIPLEANHYLKTKLQQIITLNGFVGNDNIERFVLAVRINILAKNIVPSTPIRISQKLEISFMIGDIIENKLYETAAMNVTAIGANETKSLITAFSKINPLREEFFELFSKSKEKITLFYTKHCDEILSRAMILTKMQKYDESISLLLSIPNICPNCYERCQQKAVEIYKCKINEEGQELLMQAQNEWIKATNAIGAHKALIFLGQINPLSDSYRDIEKLRNEILQKLQSDEKKEWELQMRKYQDQQNFKRSIVDAVKAIGVAWGNGQPQSVTKTIIRSWW